MSRSFFLGLMACGVLNAGCGDGASSEAASLGTLSVPLATEVNGLFYRLSGVSFSVTGPETFDFSTTGDDAVLVRSLTDGDYQIEIRGDWRLEKEASSGFVEVDAELTSENPQSFQIAVGQTTRVSMAFATDGVPVVLGPPGILIVGLDVTDSSNPGPSAADAGAAP